MLGFSDETKITTVSGNGGSGCVSFRREKYVPRGGPDGGDGGRGGDVVFEVKQNLRTLAHLSHNKTYKAEPGRPGEGRRKHGKDGEPIIIPVPPGTVIRDADTGDILKEFFDGDEPWVFLEGGKGGKGNWHFKTSIKQAPKYAQPGLPGESYAIIVEMRIIADIGFVGFPNAGKSSLLNACTNARSKVAGYPFTTKIPHLGVLRVWDRDIVLADIPGILEGASQGTGLGLHFLKHISRTSGLAYFIDLSDDRYLEAFETLRGELKTYGTELLEKPFVVVATKLDLPDTEERFEELKKQLDKDIPCFGISVFTQEGIDELKETFFRMVEPENTHEDSSIWG